MGRKIPQDTEGRGLQGRESLSTQPVLPQPPRRHGLSKEWAALEAKELRQAYLYPRQPQELWSACLAETPEARARVTTAVTSAG